MKRWLIFTSLILLGCIVIAIAILYNYYAPPVMRPSYQTIQHHDDTLRIAYIGDSWAAMHKEYNGRMAKMIEDSLHRPVKVQSYGICGLTSKEIYNELFDNRFFRQFMEKGYDYCFISAGINDTYKKMSVKYYKTSIDCIIQFMLANYIRPIILEIPDYDIQKSYERQKTSKKTIRHISMIVNGTPLDCKQLFRDTLNELIIKKGCEQAVCIIRYKEWNNNYEKDLKKLYIGDGMHLNGKGYIRLDSCIAKHIY